MKKLLLPIATAVALLASGCSTIYDKHVEWELIEPASYPVLNAIGYAPITAQPGSSEDMKMLMAIKASKLDAYRELTEQVYGQRLESEQSLASLVVNNSQLKASVAGVIRGARVVKTYPVGENTYATELELDMQKVYDIYLTTAKPRKIRNVTYY